MQPARTAAVFLVALGVLTVMTALVFGFLTSGQLHAQASRKGNALPLARMAAQAGLAHACYAIDRSYVGTPGIPTNLRQSWRSEFLPFASGTVGKLTATTGDDRPFGREFSSEEASGADSPTDDLLIEPYSYVSYNSGDGGGKQAAYTARNQFANGRTDHPGGGLHIEPGRIRLDRSSGTALRWAQGGAADIDVPLLLDGDLVGTSDPARARYRLRYAVAVDDLSSRILTHAQGRWIDPGASPSAAQAVAGAEVEPTLAAAYADAFANMTVPMRPALFHVTAGTSFAGHGSTRGPGGTTDSTELQPMLAACSGSNPQVWWETVSGSNVYTGLSSIGTNANISYGSVGAPFSWAAASLLNFADKDRGRFAPWCYTPFGDRGSMTAPATSARYAYTDCPWRINFPTATPQVINQIFYALMPREFHIIVSTDRSTIPTGPDITKKLQMPMADLYDTTNPSGARFAFLSSQRYPGSNPDIVSPASTIATSDGDWSTALGKDIDLNDDAGSWKDSRIMPQPPQQGRGIGGGFEGSLLPQYEEKSIGTHVRKARIGTLSNRGVGTAPRGFAYHQSYFMDIAVAFMHMVAAGQFAWMGETGASWSGAPTLGVTRYPDGTPTVDLDVDGDGLPDLPSRFDSPADLDRQFLNNLGEQYGDYSAGSRTSATRAQGLVVVKSTSSIYSPAALQYYTTNNNISSLRASGLVTGAQASLMELVLNDVRMSFFGASPQYPDFTPMDFDDNGTVRASCYPSGSAPADPATGRGPIPTAAQRYSLTGYFVFQKSRYYRLFIRGEVVDMFRMLPLAKCTMEYVYCVDPDATLFDINNQPTWAAGSPRPPLRSTILFQRQHWNRYEGNEVRSDD